MKYNELDVKSSKSAKRVGRGISAGQGKTAGRGTKGQKSRTGSSRRPGFEGGQNPLSQRFPKLRGFKSHQTPRQEVNVADVALLKAGTVDTTILAEQGLITNAHVKVKLIGKADLDKKFDVKLQAASAGAIESVKKAGGTFTEVEQLARQAAKPS